MRKPQPLKKESVHPASRWLLLIALLGSALAVLFYQSFEPYQVLFANDVSLGWMKSSGNRMPGAVMGLWEPLNWIGYAPPAYAFNISAFPMMIFPPEMFMKIYAPFTLFFLGFCAWVFFRQLEFNPMVCVLGGIAAGLNT